MVEKARTMARVLEIPQVGRSTWKAGASDGLPSPTSPLDRGAAPSPRGWRHRDAGGVGLGILAALEAQPSAAAAAATARVSAPVSIARRAARLEVSELGCSGRCPTSLCGGGPSTTPAPGGGAAFRVAEFLACCDMCRRPLDGKDIFMYRGERAFCSMECRYHAIVSDEFKEEKERKRRAVAVSSDAPRKAAAAAEIAGSPCNGGGNIFFTGIVAA
ncbi:hypothetical protein ACP70R_014331 [Stipagrostis hirtigluma subsp. patula]